MRNTQLSYIFAIILVTGTGCTSTTINDSLALISQAKMPVGNPQVLNAIQALRVLQPSPNYTYTFAYALHKKELNSNDINTITQLLEQYENNIVIHIALAKGQNRLQQFTLSMARAKQLYQHIARFNHSVSFVFSPELSTDTLNLVIGA